MERWEIRASPNSDDPQRHLLLVRGGPADVSAVLKKFGALCGRPTPLDGDDFNLSFVLHKATPEVRKKLKAWLGQISPKEKAGEEETALPPPPPAPTPIPPPPRAPSAPPPTELRMATPRKTPTPAPTPAPAKAKVGAAATSLTDELRADWTFETLLVGAYNRFAHAAAMSVVGSPGAMYNPLFLYGAPGTGKSHLLYSIANSMSKGLGTSSLLLTSGSRLSRAVSVAGAAGSMSAIDKKVEESTALFVEDIHLLAVTDHNN
jgi:chromosomal replication initiator protein